MGDNTFGSIHPSVCLFVLSCLNRVTYDLVVTLLLHYLPRSKGDNAFGSVRQSVYLFTLSCLNQFYWRGVVDGTWLAKCSKKSYETQVRYTYKITARWSSQRAFKIAVLSKLLRLQNGCAFKWPCVRRSIMLLFFFSEPGQSSFHPDHCQNTYA